MNQPNSFTLRPLQANDAADLYNTIDSQRDYLGRWLPFVASTQSVAYTQEFVNYSLQSEEETFTIRHENQFIGLIGFKATDKDNCKTEIGYWLSEEYQGRGIMTNAVKELCHYAFQQLGINRIQLKCAVGNSSSSNIPKRIGFQFEGIERAGEQFPDGSFADLEIYSLLKGDLPDLETLISG